MTEQDRAGLVSQESATRAADPYRSSDETVPDSGTQEARDASTRAFRRRIFLVFMAGLAALLAMALLAGWLMLRSAEFNRWIDHAYLVESHVADLEALIERGETARRGYLLIPNDAFRQTYDRFRGDISPALDRIAVETFDNPIQSRAVKRLRTLTSERDDRIERIMALAASGRLDDAVSLFRQNKDQPLLEDIRSTIRGMLQEEARLLRLRTGREADNARILFVVVALGGLLLAGLAFGALAVVRRYAEDLDRSQAALRALNAGLERRVLDRTAELSRANDEIQRFAYIVSHDLRSPLVNVMGFTTELELSLKPITGLVDRLEAAAPGSLDESVLSAVRSDMPEAIGFIRTSTRKMDGLIKAILALSREGRRLLLPEPLQMGALVGGIFDSVRHRLDEAGCQAVIEGTLPDIVSDRLAVEQVLGNLVDNAVKYLKPGRPGRIVVRGHAADGRAEFDVVDNGRGIDPKDHERIFELFRRSGVQDQAGEGIGLAHVRALVYRLGGLISCRSELDQGAVFHLSLPLKLNASPP